jgi:hypothetical protein
MRGAVDVLVVLLVGLSELTEAVCAVARLALPALSMASDKTVRPRTRLDRTGNRQLKIIQFLFQMTKRSPRAALGVGWYMAL